MKLPSFAPVEFDNRVQEQRFWLLVIDACMGAYVILSKPDSKPVTTLGKALSEFPVAGSGGLMVIIAVMLVLGRYFSHTLLRVAHAFSAAVYVLFGAAIITVLFLGDPSTNGVHSLVIAWCHYNAGIDLPRIHRFGGTSKDEG